MKPEDIHLDWSQSHVSEKGKICLTRALVFLPKRIIDFAREKILFVDFSDMSALYLDFSLINSFYKDKWGMICLRPGLWDAEEIKICFAIAHEIGHALYRDMEPPSLIYRTKKAYFQENRADRMAINWLKKRFPKEDLERVAASG